MQLGFAKEDVTPRVGVELCGFGPYILRRSIAVRDRLWARAMAMAVGDARAVIVSCDLIGVQRDVASRVRDLVGAATRLPPAAVMVCCTHTHSGPATLRLNGWGERDAPYMELLPYRIARAAVAAVERLTDAELTHAALPCEGVGLNREYDQDAPPLEDVLRDGWRPAHPERTDTVCHVLCARAEGRVIGFASYFGCHPVVCCATTRYIHGDYAGVATNLLEREHPGAVGLFLQGAQGDVNSCVVHKPEAAALLALDVIAGRYARAVRPGLAAGDAIKPDALCCVLHEVKPTRKEFSSEKLRELLAEKEAVLAAGDATEEDRNVCMSTVYAHGLRSLLARRAAGEDLQPTTDLHGIRLGPIAFLGAPFEIFQAVKNDVVAGSGAAVPLVMGLTGDCFGYAPDRFVQQRGGYAADMVPLMFGELPFQDAHGELVAGLLAVDAAIR